METPLLHYTNIQSTSHTANDYTTDTTTHTTNRWFSAAGFHRNAHISAIFSLTKLYQFQEEKEQVGP